jgi:hypothetical protein
MSFSPNTYSEDDVRAKIILPWLLGQGFNISEIILEHSFSIRAGKGVFKIRNSILREDTDNSSEKDVSETILKARADILVKNSCGRNLLVIEVKAPGETLDEAARDQGISYARLLEGNIAPFVVLTNGRNTKIFNSFTKAQLDENQNLSDLADREADFHLGCEEIQLRAEAVDALISLSSQNLNAFCKSQADCRMKLLRSNDLNSGRKYIPALYVERDIEKNRLQDFLCEKGKSVVLLVGSPQVGKTNFICRMVEEYIAQGLPCLFYPAIGLKGGLFAEMAEDFEWVLRDFGASGSYIVDKLRKVLKHSNQKLVVFIDGWNEAGAEIARALDAEADQLLSANIQIVVSLTNVAADRLLGGYGGNPSLLAQAAGVNQESAELIAAKPNAENTNWSLVNIGKYTEEERDRAYEIYSEAYQVKFPKTHIKISDPYVIGAAMRLYQSKTLPKNLDEPDLLEKVLREKYKRAINLDDYNLNSCLETVGKEIYETDAPVEVQRVLELWNLPTVKNIPTGFFESALLAQVTNKLNRSAVDFYYGKERDYVICYWLKCWREKLRTRLDLSEEFNEAVKTTVGTDALRWFFSQKKHIGWISSRSKGTPPVYQNAKVNLTLIYSLCEIASNNRIQTPKWAEYALDRILNDKNSLIKIQAIKLFALLSTGAEELSVIFDKYHSWQELIITLFSVDEDFPINIGGVGEIVIESLEFLHREYLEDSDLDESPVSDALGNLLGHTNKKIRQEAANCLGRVAPYAFFRTLTEIVKTFDVKDFSLLLEYKEGIISGTGGLQEFYYGSVCPGFLDSIGEDERGNNVLKEHYEKMSEVLELVIKAYPVKADIQTLIDLLENLKPKYVDDEPKPFIDIYTLPLPFGD